LVRIYKPEYCVELGCLNGYSGIYTAKGLKLNKSGKLFIIDLFEKYSYNHCPIDEARENFILNKVDNRVEFICGDVFEKCKLLPIPRIDFLHIDISNNGKILKDIFKQLYPKFTEKSIVLFEGGSEDRDNIEWMKKYKKTPISFFLNSSWFHKNFEYFVFEPYPSLTLCKKRRGDNY